MIVRLLTEHHLEFLSFKGRLQRLVRVYICQNVKLLEIPCTGSRLFMDILTGITVFNCALHRLIHKSFVTTAHRAGERRGL